MPPASPYFTRLYFDPTYFDDDAAASGGHAPRQLRIPLPVEEPSPLDEDFLEWII